MTIPTPNTKWAHLIPDPETQPITREDLEAAIWVLTGWTMDALHVEELLVIADAYAQAVAGGQAQSPVPPGKAREALLAAGWVPTGPLPQTWVQASQKASEAASRVREDSSGENIRGLAQAIEHLCELVQGVLDWAEDRTQPAEPGPEPAVGPMEALTPTPEPVRPPQQQQQQQPTVALAPALVEGRSTVELVPVEGVDTLVNGTWVRTCSRCGLVKPLRESFHRDTKGPGGRRRKCSNCCSEEKRDRKLRKYPTG